MGPRAPSNRGTTIDRRALIAAAALLALLLAAFGPPPAQPDQGNTLVIASASPPDSIDPGMSYQVIAWQTMLNTHNGLLTYPKTEGDEGARLVPDLAATMPKVSDGGRRYTFELRRGPKFGPPLNREVLPSDIKWGIERLFLLPSPGVGFYTIIEGADDFQAKKAKEIEGIRVDDDARTIEFQLTRPDATFLYTLALPFSFAIPKGTAPEDQSMEGFVPSTGPYMFDKYVPERRIVLKRNPAFRSWSEHVPDGHVDGIEIQLGVSPDNAVTKIKRGEADASFDPIPPSQMTMLLTSDTYKEQVKEKQNASTYYVFMNTTLPPFDNVKIRQAINWAIDRRALVKLTGGAGTPTETILPETMPGYREHKLYPEQDMAKARQLIAESGETLGKVDFWCTTTEPQPTLAQYMQDVLNQLGFEANVKCINRSSYFTLVGNKTTQAKIGFGNWSQDFPEGSNFIDVLLNGKRITPEHNNNFAMYSGADEQIAEINGEVDQAKRNRMWGELDEQIMRDAPWAPYMHGIDYDFVSGRVSDYTYSPVYGLLFMKLHLKGASEGGAGGTPDSEAGTP